MSKEELRKKGFTPAWWVGLGIGIVSIAVTIFIAIPLQVKGRIQAETQKLEDTLLAVLERNSLLAEYQRNYEYGINLAKANKLDSAYAYFETAEPLVVQNSLTMDEVNTAKAFQDHGAFLLWNQRKCEEARIRLLIADSIFSEYKSRKGSIPPVYIIPYRNLQANKGKFKETCGEPLTP